ncbi:hypothetical protein C0J52_25776 [Blattella germanica]|nr:hypothetical protein C0J52_25776 [Blattella germanica]
MPPTKFVTLHALVGEFGNEYFTVDGDKLFCKAFKSSGLAKLGYGKVTLVRKNGGSDDGSLYAESPREGKNHMKEVEDIETPLALIIMLTEFLQPKDAVVYQHDGAPCDNGQGQLPKYRHGRDSSATLSLLVSCETSVTISEFSTYRKRTGNCGVALSAVVMRGSESMMVGTGWLESAVELKLKKRDGIRWSSLERDENAPIVPQPMTTEVAPPRREPAKDPPYRLMARKKTMCYIIFPQQRRTVELKLKKRDGIRWSSLERDENAPIVPQPMTTVTLILNYLDPSDKETSPTIRAGESHVGLPQKGSMSFKVHIFTREPTEAYNTKLEEGLRAQKEEIWIEFYSSDAITDWRQAELDI